MRYIKWRLLERGRKRTIADVNQISAFGAVFVGFGGLNLISYGLGGRHALGEFISAFLFNLPVPIACALLILVGAVVMGLGYVLDHYDKKRLLRQGKSGKHTK